MTLVTLYSQWGQYEDLSPSCPSPYANVNTPPLSQAHGKPLNSPKHGMTPFQTLSLTQITSYLARCPPALLTANGLVSAAFSASKLKSVHKYNPTNLAGAPIPTLSATLATLVMKFLNCSDASSATRLRFGMPPVAERGVEVVVPVPASVRPPDVKAGEAFAGPDAAAREAVVMAVRRALGSAPRIVEDTVPFLRMRKVGILS